MKKFITLCCLMAFTSNAFALELANQLDGVWEGKGSQNNGSSWTIKFTANKGEYQIEYPSLSCGGKWSLKSDSAGSAIFTETLTFGKSNCIDKGRVELYKVSSNKLKYIWYSSRGKIDAFGDLNCPSCDISNETSAKNNVESPL